MRLEKAAGEVARLEAQIDERQPEKRQRTKESKVPWTGKGEKPPHWEEFGGYSHMTYQQLETQTQRWRDVTPVANVQKGKPSDGKRDGALHHWRRARL